MLKRSEGLHWILLCSSILFVVACGDPVEVVTLAPDGIVRVGEGSEPDGDMGIHSGGDSREQPEDTESDKDSGQNPLPDTVEEEDTDDAGAGSPADAEPAEPDTSVIGPGPGGGIQRGFFAVHLDPGAIPKDGDVPNASRPKAHLDDLTALVEKADEWGHKLTLMFTGQWAYHMTDPTCLVPLQEGSPPGTFTYMGTPVSDCLSLIRAFEVHGHEVSMHHHPAGSPASWDGYTNEPPTGPG